MRIWVDGSGTPGPPASRAENTDDIEARELGAGGQVVAGHHDGAERRQLGHDELKGRRQRRIDHRLPRRGRLQGVQESGTPKRGVDQRWHGAQPAQAPAMSPRSRRSWEAAPAPAARDRLPVRPGRKRPNSTRASVSAKVRSQSAKRKNVRAGPSAARRASRPSRVSTAGTSDRAAGIRATSSFVGVATEFEYQTVLSELDPMVSER